MQVLNWLNYKDLTYTLSPVLSFFVATRTSFRWGFVTTYDHRYIVLKPSTNKQYLQMTKIVPQDLQCVFCSSL